MLIQILDPSTLQLEYEADAKYRGCFSTAHPNFSAKKNESKTICRLYPIYPLDLSIPYFFKHLSRITFCLSVGQIIESWQALPNLLKIDLSDCQISALAPAAFSGLPHLQVSIVHTKFVFQSDIRSYEIKDKIFCNFNLTRSQGPTGPQTSSSTYNFFFSFGINSQVIP